MGDAMDTTPINEQQQIPTQATQMYTAVAEPSTMTFTAPSSGSSSRKRKASESCGQDYRSFNSEHGFWAYNPFKFARQALDSVC